MNVFVLAIALASSSAATAAAQVAAIDDLWNPPSLPAPLKDPPSDFSSAFSIGPAGGYLRPKDADRGTWFGGAQARLHFAEILAAEAAVTFHQNEFEDGDIEVTQYPVQLTAMLYVISAGPIRPYVLGGVGWYYTRTDFDGVFAGIKDDTQTIFGWHFGAGAELMLGSRVSLNVDVRYIFLDPDSDKVLDQDFNYWQIAFGLNFFF